MRKPHRAVTPQQGARAVSHFSPPGDGEMFLSLLLPVTLCCGPPSDALVLPSGKRVSTFWMRASTTAWMEETEAKSSCMGSLRDRGGGVIRERVWRH